MNRLSPRAERSGLTRRASVFVIVLTGLWLAGSVSGPAMAGSDTGSDASAPALYARHCAACHGPGRLGAQGPALIPESLRRLRRKAALQVIARGRMQTQMPGYAGKLSRAEIAALVDYIYTPLPRVPEWGLAEIRASHKVMRPDLVEGDASTVRPVYAADPLNLFLVVEAGDHHVTVLDGDRLEPITRFKSRFALHGGPKYTSDGRFVYLASRDGWITKYDMYRLAKVAEVRAGINTRNAAVSSDNRFVLVGNYLPHTLVLLDARDLSPVTVIPVRAAGGESSRVSAVYNAPPRRSFIVALKDMPEIWELSYAPTPRKGSGQGRGRPRPPLPLRRIRLDTRLDDFFFDQDYAHLIGASRSGKAEVIDLGSGKVVARLPLEGMPHLGSGITWTPKRGPYAGRRILATPHLGRAAVSFIDMDRWTTIKTLKTLGPGFFMRSHEQSPYAWVDVFFGPDRDAMHVIDKETLEIVRTLRPAPGKTAAHVEFDRYGRRALVSIWDRQGAIVVYDARSLVEIKRLPMVKPSGKYNVFNKITLSEGTSH